MGSPHLHPTALSDPLASRCNGLTPTSSFFCRHAATVPGPPGPRGKPGGVGAAGRPGRHGKDGKPGEYSQHPSGSSRYRERVLSPREHL